MPSSHFHLIGIGGSGMSAIALVLFQSGYVVSGSDRQMSPLAQSLQEAGVKVYVGHMAEHIHGADIVVRSSAIMDDNPEVTAAHETGIPVVKRSEFLGQLMQDKQVIAVAGTHGKTTTTSMIAWILSFLDKNPSYIIGGVSLDLGDNAHAGKGEQFVIEADEYDGMFLGLNPDIAIITNVEHDHPDCYPTPEDFYQAFRQFTGRVSKIGTVLCNSEDPGAARLLKEVQASGKHAFSYGIGNELDYRAENMVFYSNLGGFAFDFYSPDGMLGRISLQIPGEHNVRNAVAALATAHLLGFSIPSAVQAIHEFSGVGRRFQLRGNPSGITLIDDYAHHPTEIQATLNAARKAYPERPIWVVWQPHTYSRTKALMDQFCTSFNNADHLLITDIYAAREANPGDISSKQIVERLQKSGMEDVRLTPTCEDAVEILGALLQSGDVVIVLSAGDADRVNTELLGRFSSKPQSQVNGRETTLQTRTKNLLQPLFGERIQFDAGMARFTSMRVGGAADALLIIRSARELALSCALLWQHEIPFYVIGSGSNILVSDRGIRGVVLINQAQEVRFDEQAEASVYCESGASFGLVARLAAQKNLSGLEWAAGIPGTVGGAVIGNAGAHGGEIADRLKMARILLQNSLQHVRVDLDTPLEEICEVWPVERFEYTYRSSCLKHQPGNAIVLDATLGLNHGSQGEIQACMEEFLSRRRRTQPPGASSGSMFKNPPGEHAGRLIEACGLKGVRRGDVEISQMHANFFINHGTARAEDVYDLICRARKAVKDKFGIQLELEVALIGDWKECR